MFARCVVPQTYVTYFALYRLSSLKKMYDVFLERWGKVHKLLDAHRPRDHAAPASQSTCYCSSTAVHGTNTICLRWFEWFGPRPFGLIFLFSFLFFLGKVYILLNAPRPRDHAARAPDVTCYYGCSTAVVLLYMGPIRFVCSGSSDPSPASWTYFLFLVSLQYYGGKSMTFFTVLSGWNINTRRTGQTTIS